MHSCLILGNVGGEGGCLCSQTSKEIMIHTFSHAHFYENENTDIHTNKLISVLKMQSLWLSKLQDANIS